jgi:hypothetical protein
MGVLISAEFSGHHVVDYNEYTKYFCKSLPHVIEMLKLMGMKDVDPQQAILFDDKLENLCVNDDIAVVKTNPRYGVRDRGHPTPFTSRFPRPPSKKFPRPGSNKNYDFIAPEYLKPYNAYMGNENFKKDYGGDF